MKQFFGLGHEWSEDDIAFFKRHNVVFNNDYWILVPDTLCEEVRGYLGPRWNSCMHAIKYVYSKEDICSSDYCVLSGYFSCGMPKFDDDVHNDPSICPRCHYHNNTFYNYHIGKISKHRLWGFSAWVYDALFVSLDLYKTLFEPIGIQSRAVRRPNNTIIDDVLQLVIPITNEALKLPLQEFNVCQECGEIKYLRRNLYPFHPLHDNPLPYIYLSKEQYGAGWESCRKVFISTSLAIKLIEMKELKYEWLIPCKKDFECSRYFAAARQFMNYDE